MNELCTAHQCVMKNGTPYQVQQCIEPGTEHSAQFLRGQIVEGLAELSLESRWHRFANPIHKLTGDQLDILVDLDYERIFIREFIKVMMTKKESERLILYCLEELRLLIERPYMNDALIERLSTMENNLELLYQQIIYGREGN